MALLFCRESVSRTIALASDYRKEIGMLMKSLLPMAAVDLCNEMG